jgi:phosphopantetheine adenylyltransferase
MDIQCIVAGDVPNAGLLSRSEVLSRPEIQAVYTYNPQRAARTIATRRGDGPNSVDVVDTNTLIESRTHTHEAPEVFYFEDLNGHTLPTCETVAVGGSFDQLHNGHRKLLTMAASITTKKLLIGVMGDALLREKANAHLITKFSLRKEGVESFIHAVKPSLSIDVVELADPFGPTISQPDIDAIVVSSETILGAMKINEIRIGNEMKPLKIFVTRRRDGAVLSSSFIREKCVQESQS